MLQKLGPDILGWGLFKVVDSLNTQQINLLNDLKKKLYGSIHYPTRSPRAPIKFQALGVECKSRHASWKTYII